MYLCPPLCFYGISHDRRPHQATLVYFLSNHHTYLKGQMRAAAFFRESVFPLLLCLHFIRSTFLLALFSPVWRTVFSNFLTSGVLDFLSFQSSEKIQKFRKNVFAGYRPLGWQSNNFLLLSLSPADGVHDLDPLGSQIIAPWQARNCFPLLQGFLCPWVSAVR